MGWVIAASLVFGGIVGVVVWRAFQAVLAAIEAQGERIDAVVHVTREDREDVVALLTDARATFRDVACRINGWTEEQAHGRD